jgi:hypothetical protein
MGKPVPAEAPPPAPAEQVPNVVRTPYPAQSVEAWQAEAEAYRASQAKIHGSPQEEADEFFRQHKMDPSKGQPN